MLVLIVMLCYVHGAIMSASAEPHFSFVDILIRFIKRNSVFLNVIRSAKFSGALKKVRLGVQLSSTRDWQ